MTDFAASKSLLESWADQVTKECRAAVDEVCSNHDALRSVVSESLEADEARSVPSRLLSMMTLGALTGAPESAVPVCAVSRLWWLGAELLDDLADDHPGGSGFSQEGNSALFVGIACATLLPQMIIDRQPLSRDIKEDWQSILIRTSLQATAGQMADVAKHDAPFTWATVMATYRGKSGAPYSRDTTMAARLVTDDATTLRRWHVFGELFGVLRQMCNDGATQDVLSDEDFANGTSTLIMAHAFDVSTPSERANLMALHTLAMTDPDTRGHLRNLLLEPRFSNGYKAQIVAIRQRLCGLTDMLAPPSHYRKMLHSVIHTSAHYALCSIDQDQSRGDHG